MKQPSLIVEGEKHEVLGITWFGGKVFNVRVMDERGVTIPYSDISENPKNLREGELQIDIEKCLVPRYEYDDLYDALSRLIESQQKEITDLALQYSNHETPYPDYEIKKKHDKLMQRTLGLIDAQEIVSEFMTEDVDLSGGEEVE